MKAYKTNEIKNIAILGNDGAGKTTLTESLLFEAGLISRRGKISAKNTASDYFPVEQEYGYSVFSTVFHAESNGKKLNFIDCPGSDDFAGAAITALNVTDTALILMGYSGVEVGTQNHFRYTEKLGKPVVFLLNQADDERFDYESLVERTKATFGSKVMPIQFPVAAGPDFNAIIDVLTMKKYSWGPDGGKPKVEDIPADLMDKATEMHMALVEAAAEHDEALLEKFFESEELTEDEIREGVRKGMAVRGIFPLVVASAGKDMGMNRLMEFLGNVVPMVTEMPKVKNAAGNEVAFDPNGNVSLFFFKTAMEPHIGEVQYFKVMSGTVTEGMDLSNANRGSKERMGQLFACAAAQRIKVDSLQAGDIGCAVKLKDVKTGDTLNDKGSDQTFNYIKYPDPKYIRAIKPVSESDNEKMMAAIYRMAQEDPTWVVEQNKELRQTLIKGQGEFHLRTLKWRLENNDKIMIELNPQRIPYRETITKAARAGQFGEVHMIVEPYTEGMPDPTVYRFGNQEYRITPRSTDVTELEWGGKLVFINSVVGGAIDTRFMPAILKGVMERMERGPLTESYARDVRVIVYDGKMHPVDSNEISFMLAARNAFSQAFREAGPKILEPIYDLEVLVPGDMMGDVMSDLQGRRGLIMGMSSEGGMQKLNAKVPLAELANYSTALSSITGSRASFTMKFASYELVPQNVQDELIAANQKEED